MGPTTTHKGYGFSRISAFDDFSIGTATDDGIEIDLVTTKANTVEWLAPTEKLIAGCAGAEVAISATSTNVFGPATVEQRRTTIEGSFKQQPIIIDNNVTFIQAAGNKIINFGYDFQSDSQQAKDLTILNEEIGGEGFVSMAYATTPQRRLYAVKKNGDLGVYTFTGQGGGWTTYTTLGNYIDVTVVSSSAGDKVYTLVNRDRGGIIRTYLETFNTSQEHTNLANYLDSTKDRWED